MGIVHKGIHEKLALKLKRKFNLSYFVETGTHTGRTALWASKHFRHVYTVELYKKYVDISVQNCKGKFNVEIIRGDSSLCFGEVLNRLPKHEPALIWLDAHWSRDLREQKTRFGECPVLDEIEWINLDKKPHVIMIDDARLFKNPPPKPHNPEDWPTFDEVFSLLNDNGKHLRDISIIDDVIVAQPEGE